MAFVVVYIQVVKRGHNSHEFHLPYMTTLLKYFEWANKVVVCIACQINGSLFGDEKRRRGFSVTLGCQQKNSDINIINQFFEFRMYA